MIWHLAQIDVILRRKLLGDIGGGYSAHSLANATRGCFGRNCGLGNSIYLFADTKSIRGIETDKLFFKTPRKKIADGVAMGFFVVNDPQPNDLALQITGGSPLFSEKLSAPGTTAIRRRSVVWSGLAAIAGVTIGNSSSESALFATSKVSKVIKSSAGVVTRRMEDCSLAA